MGDIFLFELAMEWDKRFGGWNAKLDLLVPWDIFCVEGFDACWLILRCFFFLAELTSNMLQSGNRGFDGPRSSIEALEDMQPFTVLMLQDSSCLFNYTSSNWNSELLHPAHI